MAKFYITSPIYYANAPLHVGSAFEIVGIDALARYRRLAGDDVFFLTGLDEHGEKVQKAAEKQGRQPQDLVDELSESFQLFLRELNITNDDLIRTTQERHKKCVQALFDKMRAKGDVYKGVYEGEYCFHCENYVTEGQRTDKGVCPDCGRATEKLQEDAYFFRASRYNEVLKKHIEENPDFIQPDFRRTEMVRSFLEKGLQDICISRTSIYWGVPVPGDEHHVIYVWFDALINYVSAIGYLEGTEKFRRYWPADLHVVGKDILRFHTLVWPAMLLAAGIELPKRVFGHGFIYVRGAKMSKSLGNIVNPVDVAHEYGVDALRYYLLRETPYGMDGYFSFENLVDRINNELADDLGNLVYRVASMINKYRDGVIPEPESGTKSGLQEIAASLPQTIDEFMNDLQFNRALEATWQLIQAANRYVEEKQPWALAKDTHRQKELDTVLYTLAEAIRIAAVFLWPILPGTAERIFDQFGAEIAPPLETLVRWGGLRVGSRVKKAPPLFPKVEPPEAEEDVEKAAPK